LRGNEGPKMAEFKTTQIWTRMIEYFFKKKLNIDVYYFYFRDDIFLDDYYAFLFPYSDTRNMLSYNDIQKIRDFFGKKMEMKDGDGLFEKELQNVREEGMKNGILTLEFYYNALFIVEIPLIYAKINDKEYFFMSHILLINKEDDEDMNEMLINKAMNVLARTNVLKELMEEWKKYEKKEKNVTEETDKYPEVKDLVDALEEFKIPYSVVRRKIKIRLKEDGKISPPEISLYASMSLISENGVEIIIKEGLFSNDKKIMFISPDGKTREVTLGNYVKFDIRDPYLILKFKERC
jgi:hypothetical protein